MLESRRIGSTSESARLDPLSNRVEVLVPLINDVISTEGRSEFSACADIGFVEGRGQYSVRVPGMTGRNHFLKRESVILLSESCRVQDYDSSESKVQDRAG